MHKIMIVDDEVNALNSLKRMLSRMDDWDIVTYSDPHEALKIANTSHFDLFISDYRMPDMNGVEFLVFTKQHNPHSMRLILSGATDFSGLVNAINQAQIYRFIDKPVNTQELKLIIKQALQFYDLADENRCLSEQVRKQQNELYRRESALKKLAEEHPSIAQISWGPDGSIILDEEDTP